MKNLITSSTTADLTLSPNFDPKTQEATSISVELTYSGVSVKAYEKLLTLELLLGNVPTNRYDGEALTAFDSNGPLLLKTEDEGYTRFWLPRRSTHGPITCQFKAFPRTIMETTPLGPRADIQAADRALIGTGMAFIPVTVDKEMICDCQVTWDLSSAPADTKASWTFGDGPSTVTKRGSQTEILQMSVYAVGPLRSYTHHWTTPSGLSHDFGFYWIGSPRIFKGEKLAQSLQDLYARMSDFFKDSETSYRIYARRRPFRGFGGSAFTRSFILEFSDGKAEEEIDEEELFYLLSHEMVHNWPRMEGPGKFIKEDEGTWFVEGVANYYMYQLPHVFKLDTPKAYLHQLNQIATSYYTSPVLNLSNEETNSIAWSNFLAQGMPYVRGCLHLIDLNYRIRNATGGKYGIDEPILNLYQLCQQEKPYTQEQWLDFVSVHLGREEAVRLNEEMASGKTIILAPDAIEGLELVKTSQLVFETGWDWLISVKERRIEGVAEGSRAWTAGLRSGDHIVWMTRLSYCTENYDKMLTVVVTRDGVDGEIVCKYWPRGDKIREAWVWREVDEAAEL